MINQKLEIYKKVKLTDSNIASLQEDSNASINALQQFRIFSVCTSRLKYAMS